MLILSQFAGAAHELDGAIIVNPYEPEAVAAAIEQARDLLEAAFSGGVTSDMLEEATGLERFTLARQFRRRLGTSPYRYLTMRRLDHAKARMRAGDSLAGAAAASGFADQSHMTRQFRRAYGLAPGRWRAILILSSR